MRKNSLKLEADYLKQQQQTVKDSKTQKKSVLPNDTVIVFCDLDCVYGEGNMVQDARQAEMLNEGEMRIIVDDAFEAIPTQEV